MRARRTALVVLLVSALGAAALAAAVAVAAPAAAPIWAGTWETSRGPLVIAVSGSAVTGTFGYADSRNEPVGHLTGTATGATVTGKWSYEKADFAPLDHGSFTLTYATAAGKAAFSGKLVFEANGSDFDWDGTCSAGACQADTQPPSVRVFPATARAGAPAVLRYRLGENSGLVAETVTVTRGAAVLWRKAFARHPVTFAGTVTARSWAVPATAAGKLVLTVVARDAAGNVGRGTAALTVR